MFGRKKKPQIKLQCQNVKGSQILSTTEFEYPKNLPIPRIGETIAISSYQGAYYGEVVNVIYVITYGNPRKNIITVLVNY